MTNLKYEAWMNGVALGSVSPNLFVSSIQPVPAQLDMATGTTAGRYGERREQVKYTGAQAKISFVLRKTTNEEREAIVRSVCTWAREGILEISSRPGHQLHVMCLEYPYVPDECSWTDPITMTLQAYERPFWEEKIPATVSLSGTSGSGTLYIPGNIGKAFVEVTVTPQTGTMANITLTVDGSSFVLNGVNATAAQLLKITYDETGLLSIKRGTTSVMDKRTAGSSDDLLAECGKTVNISFSASSAASSVRFSVRGLWM